MRAQLGTVRFELLETPEAVRERYKWDYVEHKVLDEKSHLQKMGSSLRELTLKIKLSATFGVNPSRLLSALYESAESEEPLPFIMGDGTIVGKFVIEEITKEWKQTDAKGRLLSVELEVKLKEWK
jgi:phage protein U